MKIKQNRNKKIKAQIFRRCYVQHMPKISRKIVSRTLVGPSWNRTFRFLNKSYSFWYRASLCEIITSKALEF